MSRIIPEPRLTHTNALGVPYPGALCATYFSGTSTPATTWQNAALTILHANPIEILGDGRFPVIYGDAGIEYKLQLTDAFGGNARTIDPASPFVLTQAEVGEAFQPQTAAESDALVVPVNSQYPAGHVYRYATNTSPGTTDMTVALNATLLQANQGGADPIWPGEVMAVSTLNISAKVNIRTAGYATVLQQKLSTTVDTSIITIRSSDVNIEPFSARGNIATDASEHMHVVQVGGTSAVSRVTLQGIKASDIRGDVVYLGGTPTFPLKDVVVGHIDGTNIYRNVLSVVGCADFDIGSVTGSQIGYRLYDIEPNAGSNESPTFGRIRFCRGSNIQFAGDPVVPIGHIRVDFCELDNALHADSVPGYPTHPTAVGNIAVIMGNTRSLHFGALRVRGYADRVINDTASTVKCRLTIDHFDCDTSNTTETTFKALIAGLTLQSLVINGGTVVLQGVDRYICKDVQCTLRNLIVSGGAIAASGPRSEFHNLQVDASSLASSLFNVCSNSTLTGVVVTNDASATLMTNCADNVLTSCSAAPAVFSTGGTSHKVVKSTFNAVAYDLALLPGGIVTLGASGTSPVLAGSGTISTATSVSRVSPAGAVTGIILQAGLAAGQEVTVINESVGANTITFAAAGTSNVADGVTTIIAGLRCGKFTWSAATSRWYRS